MELLDSPPDGDLKQFPIWETEDVRKDNNGKLVGGFLLGLDLPKKERLDYIKVAREEARIDEDWQSFLVVPLKHVPSALQEKLDDMAANRQCVMRVAEYLGWPMQDVILISQLETAPTVSNA